MPKNKQQLRRIYMIDERLNRFGGSFVPTDELLRICDISLSTLKSDIQTMRNEYEAPIEYNRKNKGYFYTEVFQIPQNLSLGQKDINALKLAADTLNQYKHLKAFQDVSDIIERIERTVRFKSDHVPSQHIYFERVPIYHGTEFIEPLLEAIEYEQQISFTYQSFKSELIHQIILDPYAVKEHTNRWYIIGYNSSWKSFNTYALDRIYTGSLELLSSYFNRDLNFSIENFFKYSVGMTVYHNQEPLEIILSFTPLQAKYFQSKPFHPYTIIEENHNHLLVEMKLIINYELIRILAGMGNGVKVIRPTSLIDRLKKYLENTLGLYSD